ncbi:dihydroneopterin aldolase [Microbacterium album]|uniref:7,8-dihydroneopterin aldolase n=1 Tax=Microbacterium album TaxID=2053191 RepID=A0A917MML2_9MICO|nr:dihydroneopterin aldolase [Microbacterium album]GGH45069.1 7,8-dihydroneopterin aldolase [Microbacterium album]
MSDLIRLRGLRAYGYHGVFDFERENGQEFVIDVELHLAAETMRRAAASDDVADTVHYGELAERVVAIVQGEPVNLIETLAHRIAGAVMADRRVQAAAVTVHKPQAPIPATFEDVSVTVRASREPDDTA